MAWAQAARKMIQFLLSVGDYPFRLAEFPEQCKELVWPQVNDP